MMTHQTNKTILIVCEGENTEPSYFESIKDFIIDKLKVIPLNEKPKIRIRISPIPKREKDEIFTLRKGAKKRELKKLNKEEEDLLKTFEVEEEYKTQPVRYVREAQMGLENNSYDEVWAVFDKNGHPKHKEAFELAAKRINNKIVNIAFNSVSFEQWILLHFEQNSTSFNKSQCKEDGAVINCGSKSHAKDCNGTLCICGYLIVKGYSSKTLSKKKFLFQELPVVKTAIDNSVWLRNNSNNAMPIYEINPFTSLDRLVFRLINLPIDFIWFDDKKYHNNDISFTINRIKNIVSIRIKNLKPVRQILHAGLFGLFNSSGLFYPFGEKRLLDIDEELIKIDLQTVEYFNPIFLGMKEGEKKFLFTDL